MRLIGISILLSLGLSAQVFPPATGGDATTPGGSVSTLQYNNAGAFGAVPGSIVRPTGSVEVGPYLGSPYGGVGSFQNFLKESSTVGSDSVGNWTLTNATYSAAGVSGPAQEGAQGFSLVTSTSSNGYTQQCYNTSTAMTGRAFTASVWATVPSTPVTARIDILSNTPTTAGSNTFALTTTPRRIVYTAPVFGTDAGTQVCIKITPVNSGTGAAAFWGAQLEEAYGPNTFGSPAVPVCAANDTCSPSPYKDNTDTSNQSTRVWGLNVENQGAGIFHLGLGVSNKNSVMADGFMVGLQNYITSNVGVGFAWGQSITLDAPAMGFPFNYAWGRNISTNADDAQILGQGVAFGSPLVNDVDSSLCMGMGTAGNASDGKCAILIRLGTSTAPGKVEIGDLKTTGAAGSKKVVCVDTATGRLYASSSDTACAN